MSRLNKFLLMLYALLASSLLGLAQQTTTVTGTVRDATGAPLHGATISEKGKSGHRTATGPDGSFKLVATPNAKLVISYVGFESIEVDAKENIAVTLQTAANSAMNEVVVTSLGIQKQEKSLGYATTTIKSSELVVTAPTNFATALYGKAPGVRIAAAPGGSLGGVAIQIRGINSLFGRTQPLIVMDGVPIHDGNFDNTNYWGDQRLRGNSLIDLNPEDIESITVLKGASAAALYGSEATNGVLIVTTKAGKGKKGFSVDVNATYFHDKVAYLPRFQNVRGAGSPVQYDVNGEDADGFNINKYTIDGQQYRATAQTSINYGPKFDGKPIATWTGKVVPYSPIKNGYERLFQQANNTTANIAMNFVGDNGSTRISFTQQHYEGLSLKSSNDKYITSINSSYKLGSRVKFNLTVNDIFSRVNNRPFMTDRLINNFTGMMPTFDDGAWYQQYYQTSLGYKYVTGSNNSLTPSENLKIPNYRTDILDFMWNVLKNKTAESNNRLIANATAFVDITKDLQLRGRLATDWATNFTESKSYSSTPSVIAPSGSYSVNNNSYGIIYGDVLLTYTKKLTPDVTLHAMAGYTGDRESSSTAIVSTDGGLVTDNRFDLTSSQNKLTSSGNRTYLIKDAMLGTINASYKDYLFVEGTLRRDRTSVMNPNNNTFVYPSANA